MQTTWSPLSRLPLTDCRTGLTGSGRGRFGKRIVLEQDSSLGLGESDMSDIDLSRLLGGKSCSVLCTLFKNGYCVLTSALADSGANAYTLLDTACAQKLSLFLNQPVQPLPSLIPVRGFNRRSAKPITDFLRVYLRVDGRCQYNVPFLVTDIGSHDVIIGRKWMSYLNVKLDVRKRRFVWPDNLPRVPSFVKEISTTMETLLRPVKDDNH